MKLDVTDVRYVTSDEFRVLTAVEMGSKNHEVVPTPLIVQISGLRNGGVNKMIGSLAKRNLVAKVQNSKYEGYRLTYGGYDYLAMRALSKRNSMYSVGNQIGVGKEADIYIVADAEGLEMVLKLHRLGRISFRAVKEKRDYLGKRKAASWMYLSRLAAQKEWEFMKVLYEHGFPVPKPIDHTRHCVLMSYIDGYPLRQISDVQSPGKLYSILMDLIVRFARAGLIHGDFNEFNILIRRKDGEPIIIDFPQMVSTSHENAEWYFNRDVECIRTFFKRRFSYESTLYPRFKRTVTERGRADGDDQDFQLDVVVAASGFTRQKMQVLEGYMEAAKKENVDESEGSHSDEESEGERSEEEEESGVPREGNLEDTELRPQEDSECIALPTTSKLVTGQAAVEDVDTVVGEFSEPPSSLSDECQISRSPPHSRASSPFSLDKMTASLRLSAHNSGIKDVVSTELKNQRARLDRKYHSKRGVRRAGRAQGSKAKQNLRYKGDVWE